MVIPALFQLTSLLTSNLCIWLRDPVPLILPYYVQCMLEPLTVCLMRIAIYKPLRTVKKITLITQRPHSQKCVILIPLYFNCSVHVPMLENIFFIKSNIFTSVRKLCTEFYAVFPLHELYVRQYICEGSRACLSLGAWAILLFQVPRFEGNMPSIGYLGGGGGGGLTRARKKFLYL